MNSNLNIVFYIVMVVYFTLVIITGMWGNSSIPNTCSIGSYKSNLRWLIIIGAIAITAFSSMAYCKSVCIDESESNSDKTILGFTTLLLFIVIILLNGIMNTRKSSDTECVDESNKVYLDQIILWTYVLSWILFLPLFGGIIHTIWTKWRKRKDITYGSEDRLGVLTKDTKDAKRRLLETAKKNQLLIKQEQRKEAEKVKEEELRHLKQEQVKQERILQQRLSTVKKPKYEQKYSDDDSMPPLEPKTPSAKKSPRKRSTIKRLFGKNYDFNYGKDSPQKQKGGHDFGYDEPEEDVVKTPKRFPPVPNRPIPATPDSTPAEDSEYSPLRINKQLF